MQCDVEIHESLKSKLGIFPPIIQKSLVSRNGIGDLMKKNAKEERLLSQPRKKLKSGLTSQNGTLPTLLLLFYL